jgi:serine phosphatase RsbU (regulator of sigma subunit)
MLGFDRLMEIVSGFAPKEDLDNIHLAMLEYLKQEIFAFTGNAEQHDDMTMVVVRV